jgi:DNA invertase Pin-like site-specific DNA recombinase
MRMIIDRGESAKSDNRPAESDCCARQRCKVQRVIIPKLDCLTRFVKDLYQLLDLFERKNVALVSVRSSWTPARRPCNS